MSYISSSAFFMLLASKTIKLLITKTKKKGKKKIVPKRNSSLSFPCGRLTNKLSCQGALILITRIKIKKEILWIKAFIS